MEAALQRAQERSHDRAVYEYELPEEIQALKDRYVQKSVGLVKLRMDEEITAAEKAGSNQAKLAYTWARFALYEVDGRRVKKDEGEDETIITNTDPLIRELIVEAYADLAANTKETTKKFLGSRKVKVG